jgi:phage tail sheath protein FI
MDAPNVKFRTVDLTQQVEKPANGITFVVGKAIKGPVNDPSTIINSWPQFVKLHGGLMSDDNTPLLVKRLLDKGGAIRFCRVAHYTTISDASTLTMVKAVADAPVWDVSDNELFELVMKYPGAYYNNYKFDIMDASNGADGYFNLKIYNVEDDTDYELYQNLTITGAPTVQDSDYLKDITNNSRLVDVVYKDLSVLTAIQPITPVNETYTFENGEDSDAIVDADIIGDSASKTGLYGFNDYDDAYQIIILTNTPSDTVLTAASSYADARQDLMFFTHLNATTKATLLGKKNSTNIVSKFTAFFGGFIKVLNPVNNQQIEITNIADIAALASLSDINFGPWYNFSGNKRGIITNTLSVNPNFGTAGSVADLNELANKQINMVINRDNAIKLASNFTAQQKQSQESFIGVMRGIMYIKKALRPLLEDYLDEPNDMKTWKTIFYQVTPFLDSMVTGRALYSYQWLGDQDAKSLSDLIINDPADVTNGKYKVRLMLSFIPGIQEIAVDLVLTPGNISFEDANQLI